VRGQLDLFSGVLGDPGRRLLYGFLKHSLLLLGFSCWAFRPLENFLAHRPAQTSSSVAAGLSTMWTAAATP
jgi:hypothetical protein